MDESLAEILHQKIIHNYYLTLENESKSQIEFRTFLKLLNKMWANVFPQVWLLTRNK